MKPRGHTAVMASRHEPPDSLEFFPTPPWATRALCELVLGAERLAGASFWDPCAGEGHMCEVLAEYLTGARFASDIFDYGRGYSVGSFVGSFIGTDQGRAKWPGPGGPDWIIFNPPFSLACEFVLRALREAQVGVAAFQRSNWAETPGRYRELFGEHPPTTEALFVERCPLHKGQWKPKGSTATSYSWFVWDKRRPPGERCSKFWIPPGQRKALEHSDDRRRFTKHQDTGETFL
jgi:hypothetical protein